MSEYRKIMETAENGLDKIVRDNRSRLQDGIYTKEHVDETIEKDFEQLRATIQSDIRSEQEKVTERLDELKEANSQILPKVSSVDELLRRQEIELEISLMDDEAFAEYAEKTLLNDHHYFDEMRIFSELRNRDQDSVQDRIKSIRESRLQNDPEYQELNHKASMYGVFRGLHTEVSYETEDGQVIYNDVEKIKNRVYD